MADKLSFSATNKVVKWPFQTWN